METFSVRVTRRDIRNARANHSNPITLALKRAYKTRRVRTYLSGKAVVRGTTLWLPSSAVYFLNDFLMDRRVSSFAFTPIATR
jgi:hypothetical protein